METILTDTIKSSMRILSKSAVIEQDINNSIAACKLDLQLAGVVNINENDALIIRAVTLFVKAEFNYQNAADRYKQSYVAVSCRRLQHKRGIRCRKKLRYVSRSMTAR